MLGRVLNMPLVLIAGNKNGFGYFDRIKHCQKVFPVQNSNNTNF